MDFFYRYKKIFLILGFILIVFVLGYLLYLLFFKPAPPITPTPTEPVATTTPGGLPTATVGPGGEIIPTPTGLPGEIARPGLPVSPVAQGGLTETTELNQVISTDATLAQDGSALQYYNKADGKFYRLTKDGKATLLSDKIFHQVETVVWSPNKNKAVLEYPDGANIIYDFDSDKQVTLPKHWQEFTYSPDGEQLVMKSMGLDPDNRWLAVVNEDGSKALPIEALGENAASVYPAWSPNNQMIAMYTEGIDFNRQEVFFVGLNKENFKSMVVEGRGFDPLWSPQGDRLLYSVYSTDNNSKPLLWIANAQGDNIGTGRKSLGIETWANKCIFADNINAYCAVPESLQEGAGLLPELAKNTRDNLYQIDTRTGLKKLVAIPDGNYNISNLIISDNGQYLFFTDAITGRLNKIQLK